MRIVAWPPRHRGPRARRRTIILLTSGWGMGGTIRAAVNLAGFLAPHHEVEILSVFRRRQRPFFAFPPGVRVTALDDRRPGAVPWLFRPIHRALSAQPSVLADPLDRAARHWNLWTDLMLVRTLRARNGVLVTTRPGLNLLAADLSPPGLVTIGLEQVNLTRRRGPMRRAMIKRYPRLDALVVLTEADRRRYAELLAQRTRIAVIPNTVAAMPDTTADLSSKTILAAGRLTRQKGFDLLIDAFAQVSPRRPGWRLRICGAGEEHAHLQAQIAARGLAGVVELAGSSRRLGDEMSRASTFVLSSRAEGFPLVLIEAMSHGMAVVAFDCPTGPAELIEDHHNGLLIPAADVDALALGILEMTADTALRHHCGGGARETARRYTIDEVGPRWQQLLDELAAQHHLPTARRLKSACTATGSYAR